MTDNAKKKLLVGAGALGCIVLGMILARLPTFSWAAQPKAQPAPGWLAGTPEEKFAQIERHLRGLDISMVEIGHRYGELLIAAKGSNWEYAQYQAEKIDVSLRLAVERRPKRAASAEPFLKNDVPELLAAIKNKDGAQLDLALTKLHAGCVQCHKNEKVLYFKDSVDRIRAQALSLAKSAQPDAASEQLKSGPQVGTAPSVLQTLNVTGPWAGKKVGLIEAYGTRPVAMIFAREISEPLVSLMKGIDALHTKANKLGSFAVFLMDDEAADAKPTKLAQDEKITKTIFCIDDSEGPRSYKLAKDAEVTVVLYTRRKVQANFAFRKGELDGKVVERILIEVRKIAGE